MYFKCVPVRSVDADLQVGLDVAIHVGELGRPFDLIRGQRPVLLELDQTIGVDAVALPRLGRAELLMRPAFLDLKPCLKLWVIELGASRAQARFLRLPLLARSEEHTSELQSLMRISYAVFCLKTKRITKSHHD